MIINNTEVIVDLTKYQKTFNDLIEFIKEMNYSLVKPIKTTENRLTAHLINRAVSKKIDVELVNYDDVQRLFMTINIINTPYTVVDDFVSFDIFLRKNNIGFKDGLDGDARTEEGIINYIKSYVELFRKYGTEIIASSKQLEGYYPEWT